MCGASREAAAAAPLQQQQQQQRRPPWPRPAWSSPASCKVRGCLHLRTPGPRASRPSAFLRYTPARRLPPPHASSLLGSPFPCISVPALLSVEHPSLPHSPHPIRTFLSRSRPSRSSVTGAVPWRSWGLTLGVLDPPLRKAASLPSLRRVPAFPSPSPGGARRWELPLVLTAAYLNTLPPLGPAPELALERPLGAWQRPGQWGKGGNQGTGSGLKLKPRAGFLRLISQSPSPSLPPSHYPPPNTSTPLWISDFQTYLL